MQGWVSIHRKIMSNPVWQDPKLLKLWMLCLLEASHKDHEQLVGKQIIKLEPGQFVTGRFSLAKTYNEGAKKKDFVPEITLWRWLKMLETYDFLNIKTTTKYSVVTINNWQKYQPSEQQMNNKRTSNEHQMNTNNNGNKGNNENKKDINNNASKRIIEFWDSNGFGFANTNAKNKLLMYLDEGMEEDVILRALEIACESNKISYSYVAKVLNDWSKRGLNTIKLVEAAEAEFQNRKQMRQSKNNKPIRQEMVPVYFDQPDKPKTMNPKELEAKRREVEEMLKQFD